MYRDADTSIGSTKFLYDIVARVAQCVRRGFEDEVRRTELPLSRPGRRPRQQRAIAFDETAVEPSRERGDLIAAQSPLIQELAVAGFRLPGRHDTIARRRDNGGGMTLCLVVRQE